MAEGAGSTPSRFLPTPCTRRAVVTQFSAARPRASVAFVAETLIVLLVSADGQKPFNISLALRCRGTRLCLPSARDKALSGSDGLDTGRPVRSLNALRGFVKPLLLQVHGPKKGKPSGPRKPGLGRLRSAPEALNRDPFC